MIIQNQKTMDSFSQFKPLFMDALNSGEVGVCKWIESGTTLDTALPEIGGLTDDKTEWRAIIVRYEDEGPMASFKTDSRNPYDFLVNKETSGEVRESPVPLIRLTQMLGGIPPLEIEFEAKTVQEPHKAPHIIYVPIDNSEKEAQRRRLVERYRYDGKLPSTILILTIRSKREQEERGEDVWLAHSEAASSEFWKRNSYPSICRFLAYDYDEKGPVQREADDFCFWYTVMLFCMNEWDASTLQAYRLYMCRPVMNRPAMTDAFQNLTDRLRDAREVIEKSIRRDLESEICEEEKLPDYRLQVPVPLNLPDRGSYNVETSAFPLLSRGASTDVGVWTKQRRMAEDSLTVAVRSAGRVLDQRADKIRSVCTVSEELAEPLNKYQEEDLERETREIYGDIIKLQGRLPGEKTSEDESLIEAAEKVRRGLLTRVMAGPAVTALVLAVLLVLLVAIPELVRIIRKLSTFQPLFLIVPAAAALITLLAALGVLLWQKSRLNGKVEDYNQEITGKFNKLIDSTDDYSDYMSCIASHARGRSYLNLSDRKKHDVEEEHYTKYRHVKTINVMLGKLRGWSRAFHLKVDFTTKRPESQMEVDLSLAPMSNKLYAFEVDKSYPVVINHSGITMDSPYCFAGSLEIVREELYDDGK